jgi:hypothetical protein
MGKQDVAVLLRDCREAATVIEAAEARIRELEAQIRKATDPEYLETALAAVGAVDKHEVITWRSITERPDPGRKIVAIYNDGSGATMFYVYDEGFIDIDGDDYSTSPDWLEANYDLWAYLPDKKFWCEVRAEDPMHLPVAKDPS